MLPATCYRSDIKGWIPVSPRLLTRQGFISTFWEKGVYGHFGNFSSAFRWNWEKNIASAPPPPQIGTCTVLYVIMKKNILLLFKGWQKCLVSPPWDEYDKHILFTMVPNHAALGVAFIVQIREMIFSLYLASENSLIFPNHLMCSITHRSQI